MDKLFPLALAVALAVTGCAPDPSAGSPETEGPAPSTDTLTAPDTEPACASSEEPLAVDEPSPAGLSAAEVDAVLVGFRSAPFTFADDAATEVTVEVTATLAPVWVDWSPVQEGATCPADGLRLGYDVRVSTADGAVDATVPATFVGVELPEDLFVSGYVPVGTLEAPAGAESLSVVVFQDADGGTSGELQWIVGGGGGGTSTGGPAGEVDVGAWGSYDD